VRIHYYAYTLLAAHSEVLHGDAHRCVTRVALGVLLMSVYTTDIRTAYPINDNKGDNTPSLHVLQLSSIKSQQPLLLSVLFSHVRSGDAKQQRPSYAQLPKLTSISDE
jgi:hypothetical protein